MKEMLAFLAVMKLSFIFLTFMSLPFAMVKKQNEKALNEIMKILKLEDAIKQAEKENIQLLKRAKRDFGLPVEEIKMCPVEDKKYYLLSG